MKHNRNFTLNQIFDQVQAAGIEKRQALAGKNLSGEDLSGQNFKQFNLKETVFNGANLNGCILNGSNLKNAQLKGCDLSNTKLRGVDLSYSNLSGANLRYADLHGCELNGAEVIETDLRHAYGLSPNQIYKLKTQGAIVEDKEREPNDSSWLIEELLIPIVVGVVVSMFGFIMTTRSDNQNYAPESKVSIVSTEQFNENTNK